MIYVVDVETHTCIEVWKGKSKVRGRSRHVLYTMYSMCVILDGVESFPLHYGTQKVQYSIPDRGLEDCAPSPTV
jgi:hypothetical protein